MSSNSSFKNKVTYKLFAYKSTYICKQDLTLSYPQKLVCHKIPTHQPTNLMKFLYNVKINKKKNEYADFIHCRKGTPTNTVYPGY